jgi:hypothetical protein
MGLKDMRQNAIAAKEQKQAEQAGFVARDANPEVVWEYKAVNLAKTLGPFLEGKFNALGEQGWEFQAAINEGPQSYAIFKRPA